MPKSLPFWSGGHFIPQAFQKDSEWIRFLVRQFHSGWRIETRLKRDRIGVKDIVWWKIVEILARVDHGLNKMTVVGVSRKEWIPQILTLRLDLPVHTWSWASSPSTYPMRPLIMTSLSLSNKLLIPSTHFPGPPPMVSSPFSQIRWP